MASFCVCQFLCCHQNDTSLLFCLFTGGDWFSESQEISKVQMRRVKAELAEEWSLEIEIYYKNFTKGSCSSTKKKTVYRLLLWRMESSCEEKRNSCCLFKQHKAVCNRWIWKEIKLSPCQRMRIKVLLKNLIPAIGHFWHWIYTLRWMPDSFNEKVAEVSAWTRSTSQHESVIWYKQMYWYIYPSMSVLLLKPRYQSILN